MLFWTRSCSCIHRTWARRTWLGWKCWIPYFQGWSSIVIWHEDLHFLVAWNRITFIQLHWPSQSIGAFGFLWKLEYRYGLIIYLDFITLIQIWVRHFTWSDCSWTSDTERSRRLNFFQNISCLTFACSLITFGLIYFLKSWNLTCNLFFLWVVVWALVRFFYCFLRGLGKIRNLDAIFDLRLLFCT